MTGRARKRAVIAILILILACSGWLIPSGYFAFFPGDALPVAPMVEVEGGMKDAKGAFYITTISAKEANFYVYLYAKLDPRVSLRTCDEYLPRGMNLEEYNKYSKRLMDESRAVAAVVGLKAAGIPARFTGEGVRVLEIMTDGPANGKLMPGDIILAVDGMPTNVAEELTSYMTKIEVGKTVTFRVLRGGQQLDIPIMTVEHPTQKGRPAVRIRIETMNPGFDAPVRIRIEPGDITGPSAGLMFALEVVNQVITDKDLSRGKKIAGTGTITPSGRVGPVGGVVQKVVAAERSGAEYFLVPKDNLAEAEAAARRIKVVGVETFEDALKFLDALSG